MSELKNCPFCGGEADYFQFSNPKNFYSAGCTICRCHTDGFRLCKIGATGDENKATNAKVWNRRTVSEAPHA